MKETKLKQVTFSGEPSESAGGCEAANDRSVFWGKNHIGTFYSELDCSEALYSPNRPGNAPSRR